MNNVLEMDCLSKVYRSLVARRTVTALKDVSLSVGEGEVFGYLGSNGAGKTTTVKILLRLARPSHGSVRILGGPPGGHNRSRIGYLPESPYFYDFLTPVELLTFYGRIFGIGAAARKKRIDETLEMVGLEGRRDSQLRTFSKGMTQRVGLAQAILNDPDILFLDEPTTGLDPLGRREIRDIILSLKARGKTVFLNSHLLSEVELVCDRVAILKQGRLMKLGTVEQLINRGGVEILVRSTLDRIPPGLVRYVTPPGALADADTTVCLHLEHDSETRNVLQQLLDAHLDIVSVNPRRETLEDVFVRVETGEATP